MSKNVYQKSAEKYVNKKGFKYIENVPLKLKKNN